MALVELVDAKQAADILGVDRSYVYLMIKNKTITSAFEGYPDGYRGRPGWRMYRDEIETLRETRLEKKRENKIETRKEDERKEFKKVLGELKVCLELLTETIGKLEELS